ncbi:dynamin family protein [[Phormidium ambiguum] IAM M-71]|uniref:Dynamin family protein n=1 Tax=[Phormidium ambiguum] IAM M-71 TaxID=454136 RepID=A0A1U7IR93_9CYAN|nr:dynamin family protein [Phormidium ambiguum]OKH39978.1 dynamin family protein [Phormidium ambiguum IAM M-71]
MSSQEFQAAYSSIYNTGTNLLQYLREFRDGLHTQGDDSKGLQSIENEINKALNALQDQKYQVAVVASMSAGKSSFLNAVIGADVLASENAACTVCRTEVRHIKVGETPQLLEYRETQRKPFVIAEGDRGRIRQEFLNRNREIQKNGNVEQTIRFELYHHIEAISQLSAISGFTLVDTAGPNQWESEQFNVNALKKNTLEALRTCNAILFILDYTTCKSKAASELFQEVLANRKEILADDTIGKIFFILNKVDLKTEQDPPIAELIESLKQELKNSFGFPNPIIYTASSRKGLLAKLIMQGTATEAHIKDFKKFFSAQYANEDEEGNQIIPAPKKVAPQALTDSGIPTIQEQVIETITQNAGWDLLSDVVAALDKQARAIEDTLNTELKGWQMGIEALKEKVEEYRRRSEKAREKVESVKKAVEQEKQILIQGFSQGVNTFADNAKSQLASEIDKIAETRSVKSPKQKKIQRISKVVEVKPNNVGFGQMVGEIGGTILELIPVIGLGLGKVFKLSASLWDKLTEDIPETFNHISEQTDNNEEFDPYVIRCKTKNEAQKIIKTINQFCAPHIQNWWIDTQDELVRDGTKIREELARKIQEDIQEISDELSNYLGDALEVKLNINPIQFPSFDFPGIDARVKDVQVAVVVGTQKKETGRESRCCDSDKVYYDDVEVIENRSFFDVDLQQTLESVKRKIDEQTSRNRQLLERVIEKQVKADFRNAERQINDYIQRFQNDFDRVLKERETKEAEAPEILAKLEAQKIKLNEYLRELISIRQSLDSWKPVGVVK